MSVDYEIPDPFAIEDDIETASESTVLDAALGAHDAGLCVLRVHSDGTKRPVGSWTAYQQTRPDRSTVESWFGSGHPGVGLVCGAVSGGLEMLEFEGRAVAEGVLTGFLEGLEGELVDVVGRIVDGHSETTPSGGLHLLYRCDTVDGNTKLARRPATDDELADDPADRVKVLIETRGEGGFTVVAPSHGPTHPTGQPWELVSGGFHSIATITADERAALFAYAREFDTPAQGAEVFGAVNLAQPHPGLVELGDISPWERFDREQTCHDVLLSAGFTEDHKTDDGTHYKRPGKTAPGSSATVWSDDGTCTLFSTSIDAPTEYTDGHRKLKPWALHVALNYAGDFSRAAGDERRKMSAPLSVAARTGVDLQLSHDGTTASEPPVTGRARPAGTWLFEDYVERPPIWGRDDEVLWPDGESLVIAAPTGVGKTTLTAQVVRSMIGLGGDVLGYPVTECERVLYLAMDRPQQIRRALRRIFTEDEQAVLDERLVVYPAPLPGDLGRDPALLVGLAAQVGADRIVMDSVKDAVAKVADDESGGNFNRAVQLCNAEGVSSALLHHQRKGQAGAKPNRLEDVYGSSWITAGAGSVILLWGEAGSGSAELIHLKTPSTPVGPLSIEIDTFAGTMNVTRGWDPLTWLRNRGERGGQVPDAARAMTGKEPTKASRDRARRKLESLIARGVATKTGGGDPNHPATYVAITVGDPS